MKEKAAAMVTASLAADTLASGVQGVCDLEEIDLRLSRKDLFPSSSEEDYPRRDSELTSRGVEAMLLLRSLAAAGEFDPEAFAGDWVSFFDRGPGPSDPDARVTLQSLKAGGNPAHSGATSLDIGGASRNAPIVFFYRNDLNACIEACRKQTAMTSKHPDVIIASEFFSRIAHRLMRTNSPLGVIRKTADELFPRGRFREWITMGLDSMNMNTREAILSFGQGGELKSVAPSVIHLCAKYENDLKQALIQNTMAGGDAAARGLIAGMILGAYNGADSISHWTSGLRYIKDINKLLESAS